GTWVGADDPRIRFRSTNLGQGSNTALPMVAYFMKEVNDDPAYMEIARAKFPSISSSARSRMSCDLYELDDTLMAEVERSIYERDSLMMADTLSTPPRQTFLQTLYKRKMKILLATQEQNTDQARNTHRQ
ncbi:MAG TPA: hypothetical protein VD927_13175, partial [Chryseosolibacter sp.]|nr:hypothetical protein [Chryseosolibacter sp.]